MQASTPCKEVSFIHFWLRHPANINGFLLNKEGIDYQDDPNCRIICLSHCYVVGSIWSTSIVKKMSTHHNSTLSTYSLQHNNLPELVTTQKSRRGRLRSPPVLSLGESELLTTFTVFLMQCLRTNLYSSGDAIATLPLSVSKSSKGLRRADDKIWIYLASVTQL